MFLKILLLTWTLQLVEVNPSLVIDSVSQKGLYVSNYCPKMPFCAEGAHVMCMYYDASRVFGPQCSSPMSNVTMTADLASKLVEVTNAIRGKLAMGVEKGRGGVKLPRAYGMFKLQWDNELATFAQVLANQCLLRHDMCRATKRFPNPSQAVGKTRFTYPDWHPAGTKERHYAPGLNDVKVTYAITSVMKNWYQHKAAVTAEMINHYPNWDLTPDRKDGRFYMDMVYSASTHMGCGISAYAEYGYNDNRSKMNFFGILTICNFSGSPKTGKAVYHQEPEEQTSPCGCPPNTVEDESCLCSFVEDTKDQQCTGTDCDQPVILLPVFTVEEASPKKVISKPKGLKKRYEERSNAIIPAHSLEYLDYPQNGTNKEHPIVKVLNGIMNGQHLKNHGQKPRASSRRASGKPVKTLHHKQVPAENQGQLHPRMDHVHSRKTSIFSRSVIFGTSSNPNQLSFNDFKKDVVPRKDFSKAKHLVNNYVESTKNFTNIQHRPHLPDDRIIKVVSTTTKNGNDVEEHHIITNYDNDTLHSKLDDIHRSHEKGRDTKLMRLLDKLEKEIQHIELKGNKKELFDAKIRKIYDSVIGKPDIPSHKFDHHVDLENDINGPLNHDTHHKSIDEDKHEAYEKPYDNKGKTIIDDVERHHHDDILRSSLDDDSEGPKKRRTKVKSRIEVPYDTEREFETDYEIQPRENAKSNAQTDRLLNIYRNSDNEYKPYNFPERRQSYKNKVQDHSYENMMSPFSDDEPIKRDKRLKHTRDYYKNRNINSVDNSNKNHFKRRQVTEDLEDDVLSPERRKYYQERLENLERKLQNSRTHKYRTEDTDHRRRAMRLPSSNDETLRRPSKTHLEHFDMRGRSRFIHGY